MAIDNIEKKPAHKPKKNRKIQVELDTKVALDCEAVANETGEKVEAIREMVRAHAQTLVAGVSARQVYADALKARIAKLEAKG